MDAKQFKRVEVLFWLCIGAAICVLAWKTRIGSFHEPGPGFVALFVGLFMIAMSLIMALPGSKSQEEAPDPLAGFHGVSWVRLVYTMALLFAYAVSVNALGYLVATFLLMWALFSGGKKKRLGVGLVASLITTVASYVVFETWLHCMLPRGILAW